MIKITYSVWSPILKKTYTHVGKYRTLEDFRLFAYSLYSGNWSIISQETV